MKQQNFIFFGSSEFSVFALRRIAKVMRPALVMTFPAQPEGRGMRLAPNPVHTFCVKEKLNVLTPEKLSDAWEVWDDLKPAFGIVACYGKIIKKSIPRFPLGILNIHPSLLSKYRGVSPIQTALLDGASETGVTIFKIDEGVDSGPVLAQRRFPIPENAYHLEFAERIWAFGADLFLEVYGDFVSGKATFTPQDESGATYTKKFTKEDGLLALDDAELAMRKVRAFEGWPSGFVRVQIRNQKPKSKDVGVSPRLDQRQSASSEAKLLKIHRARVVEEKKLTAEEKRIASGAFFKHIKDLALRFKQDALILDEVQLESGKRMSGREFMAGHAPASLEVQNPNCKAQNSEKSMQDRLV